MKKDEHKPPERVGGVRVEAYEDIAEFRGERWVTLSPVDEDVHKLWEFSITSGRIIQTQ